MKITVALLKSKEACEPQVELFERLWPRGLVIPKTDIGRRRVLRRAAENNVDVLWAATLLRAKSRAEYCRVCATAWSEYCRAYATAWSECYRAYTAAWSEYCRVCDSARAEYERVRTTARAEYDRVCATALLRLLAEQD